jgi:hypothetical protein
MWRNAQTGAAYVQTLSLIHSHPCTVRRSNVIRAKDISNACFQLVALITGLHIKVGGGGGDKGTEIFKSLAPIADNNSNI